MARKKLPAKQKRKTVYLTASSTVSDKIEELAKDRYWSRGRAGEFLVLLGLHYFDALKAGQCQCEGMPADLKHLVSL